MNPVRVSAVSYLNTRPLVHGIERLPRFQVRYDIPADCARLLHEHAVDIGLIPSIEYLRGDAYRIVPDLAIASRGPVASVAIFTTKPMADVRSIAMDTSSRTSVALTRVLCARQFKIAPRFESRGPDIDDMLAHADAALIIGDNALFQSAVVGHQSPVTSRQSRVEKIDLGEEWTRMTGLPFVYAFWAGRADALTADDVEALQRARDEGVRIPEQLAREFLKDAPVERQEIGGRYLRQNIKYHLGADERAALEAFYRYAAEVGVVTAARPPMFF
ncbi:MAG TPA: menaquinone biosynthesis protein [Vicinamibacterales bacterium]|nr:menaquinone biosynthesis protein [Vicinamibacterales bacterium]